MIRIKNMTFLQKVKLSLISIALVGSLGFTNVFAGKTTISRVQYNAKNTLFETKTTNTGKTGAEFKLVTGSPRRIIITTFSEDMKKLYQNGLIVTENGGEKPQDYIAGSFSSKGTKIAISYGDCDGGVGISYSTNGYIDYY